MCQCRPSRVISNEGEFALIDDGRRVKNLGAFNSGDYVLVSMGAAIEKITEQDYEQRLALEQEARG